VEATRSRPGAVIETDIPARLDALPFGRFHVLVIVALGITWILDGLEVTLAGALSGELMQPSALDLSNSQIGLAGSCYLAGAVLGAFFFGWLTDRLGRKKLFFMTLTVYLLATAATGLAWNAWSFVLFRFLTGTGIGGEYTAINSTIQELILARLRGWTDLLINGSFWVGAAMGAGGSIVLLDPAFIDPAVGWRLAFLIGTTIGLVILIMLGRLFDTIGRKVMIAITYGAAGLLLAGTGYLFSQNLLSAQGLTIAWMTVFFFASAAASSAYLTVSEIFPLEIRALAIAFFYAIGTSVGGVAGPLLLGVLISTGSRGSVAIGYFIGALLMVAAATTEALWGVAAERQPLEAVARPLSYIES
jgi:MFS family permease